MRVSKSFLKYIPVIVSLLFILLFVYTAISKILNFTAFKSQLSLLPFISDYADILSLGVPGIELLIALIFLFPKYNLVAVYFSLSLMGIFTIYIASVLHFSADIPCACGGVLSNMGWKSHLLFNLIFVVLAFIGIYFGHKQKSLHYLNETT